MRHQANRASIYRGKAAELRATAVIFQTQHFRAEMLELAEQWEERAELVERLSRERGMAGDEARPV
jgi:hypothetical protein